jgi:O-antigen/teichoic acid export membrane protein
MRFPRNTLAIADQGLASLGNFLTTIFLARALGSTEYGVFAILFGVAVLLNSIHSGLVVYPLSLTAAVSERRSVGTPVSTHMVLTLLLFPAEAAILVLSGAKFKQPAVLLAAGTALLLWQLQETTRRALLAQFLFKEVVWGDSVNYVGQFVAMLLLWTIQRLTIVNAFWAIALTSLVAGLIQIVQVRAVVPSLKDIKLSLDKALRLGKWPILTNFILLGQSVQAYVWLLGIFSGAQEAGSFQALVNLLASSHPVLFSMPTLIIPAAARARVQGGISLSWKASLKHAKQFGIMVLSYYCCIILFARAGLSWLYGPHSPYVSLYSDVKYIAFAYTFIYISQFTASFLLAIERPQIDVFANMCSLVVGTLLLISIFHIQPLFAAAVALLGSSACRALILLGSSIRLGAFRTREAMKI